MLAQLGTIIFEGLVGFDSLSRSRASSIAEHAKIVGKPGLQKTGDALDLISIGIQFHAAFCTPEDEIKKLADYMKSGEILPFVLGTGEVLGEFVISSINDDFTETDPRGAIIAAFLSIELVESFDADKLASAKLAAVENATAIRAEGTKPLRDIGGLKPTEAASISEDFKKAETLAGSVDDDIKKAKTIPGRAAYYYAKITDSLGQIENAMASANLKILNAASVAAQFPGLSGAATAVANASSDFTASMPPASADDLTHVNGVLQTSVGGLKRESAAMNGLISSRKL